MTVAEIYPQLSAEQLRRLLLGPYDYERKLQGSREGIRIERTGRNRPASERFDDHPSPPA
jgi:hypothetical protein